MFGAKSVAIRVTNEEPVFVTTSGLVAFTEEEAFIIPGVVPPIVPGDAKVAPFNELAFKFVTLVVLVTVKGAVPVETVLVNVLPLTLPVALKDVAEAAPNVGVTRVGEVDRTTFPVPVELPLIAIVPDEVIGDPVTDKKDGTVTATLVTTPGTDPPLVQLNTPLPFVVST